MEETTTGETTVAGERERERDNISFHVVAGNNNIRVLMIGFYSRTPLHYAAASRHYQCLETLVACGTAINSTDQWGRSALHYAAASDLDRR